jgi:hypothetical protein
MNLLEALARKLKNDWTGGASGDPGRYHAPGAFEDFRIADLFNNDRWTREPMVDPNSSSGFLKNRDDTPRYTSYYKPRGAVDVTETEKIGDKTVVAKFQVAPEKSNYKVFPYDPGSSVTSEPITYKPPHALDQLAAQRNSWKNDPAMDWFRMGLSTQQLRHPLYDHSPVLSAQQHYPWPALQPRRTEDEGREEEVWEFYKKLREAGYSEEDAAKATAIFRSGGDVYTGLLGEDY